MGKYMERAVHFDFHNMPALPDLGDNFNAMEFVKTLIDSKVKYINFFARCNLGYSYYPTEIGIRHPYLKDKDIFGDLLKECHKYGIGVSAYFNASLSHALADKHLNWNVVNRNGQIYNDPEKRQNSFRTMCYDGEYGEHLLAEVSELLEKYRLSEKDIEFNFYVK